MFNASPCLSEQSLEFSEPSTKQHRSAEIEQLLSTIQTFYPKNQVIPLHEPVLGEAEQASLAECIASTFVSSVSKNIDRFEQQLCALTESDAVVATVNGTSALHLALVVEGVIPGDEVITQALTFIGTANAINLAGANPVFVDSELDSLGMSPKSLQDWLTKNTQIKHSQCYNKTTGARISAIVPVSLFGHPVKINEIKEIAEDFNLSVVHDAAEALGSKIADAAIGGTQCTTIFSFNGNKIITTGGGGAVATNDSEKANKLRHLATTAKLSDSLISTHDQRAFNYRMPGINAALGVAQLSRFEALIAAKRQLADHYQNIFNNSTCQFIKEPNDTVSNYWLNTIVCPDQDYRDSLIAAAIKKNIHPRPVWQLLSESKPYANCEKSDLQNAEYLASRIVNLPSSAKGLTIPDFDLSQKADTPRGCLK